jgi:hypothetical protein
MISAFYGLQLKNKLPFFQNYALFLFPLDTILFSLKAGIKSTTL